MYGYSHGPTNCRDCYKGAGGIVELGSWRLHNNPGYYGSSNPEILVLGFSKGAHQNKIALEGEFDNIPFARSRDRLQKVLETMGVMPDSRSIDALMTAEEKQFGVASLVRCSFCKMKNGTCRTSGDVIPSSFTNYATREIIDACSKKYLSTIPSTTRLVILLGTSETYIKKTTELFKQLYRSFARINHVSFLANNALWIYAAHPSPANGHFKVWVSANTNNQQGNKRHLAQLSISQHYKPSKV